MKNLFLFFVLVGLLTIVGCKKDSAGIDPLSINKIIVLNTVGDSLVARETPTKIAWSRSTQNKELFKKALITKTIAEAKIEMKASLPLIFVNYKLAKMNKANATFKDASVEMQSFFTENCKEWATKEITILGKYCDSLMNTPGVNQVALDSWALTSIDSLSTSLGVYYTNLIGVKK